MRVIRAARISLDRSTAQVLDLQKTPPNSSQEEHTRMPSVG